MRAPHLGIHRAARTYRDALTLPHPYIRNPVKGDRARVIRASLILAQNGVCPRCGRRMTNLAETSIDHVLPIGRGGADAIGNYLLMHRGCNHEKADDLPTGCELVWIVAVNIRLGAKPDRW